MGLSEYESLDAIALADLVRRGEVTPTELLATSVHVTTCRVDEPAAEGVEGDVAAPAPDTDAAP